MISTLSPCWVDFGLCEVSVFCASHATLEAVKPSWVCPSPQENLHIVVCLSRSKVRRSKTLTCVKCSRDQMLAPRTCQLLCQPLPGVLARASKCWMQAPFQDPKWEPSQLNDRFRLWCALHCALQMLRQIFEMHWNAANFMYTLRSLQWPILTNATWPSQVLYKFWSCM